MKSSHNGIALTRILPKYNLFHFDSTGTKDALEGDSLI